MRIEYRAAECTDTPPLPMDNSLALRFSFGIGLGAGLGLSPLFLREERNKHSGGYDCEFVTPLPDAIQKECPICLRIPKEPCVISCPCGKYFCRECIERMKKDKKPCPICNKSDYNFMRQYGTEKYLKAQEVWCSQKKCGCEWKGKLEDYEQHLNPFPNSQLAECQFFEVECKNKCGKLFQRNKIAEHQNNECPKRPYSCEYCNYKSTFETVITAHHPKCSKYPVTCSNECQKEPFERESIDKHECPLEKINCPLHYVGCKARLLRKDMPEHMKDTATHLILLATVTKQLITENQELKNLNKKLEMKQSATEKLVDKLETITLGLCSDTKELKLSSRFPIDFRVNYSVKECIELPSFSTHSNGYQIFIRVYTNGSSFGKGTHVSIFTCLMQGTNDNHLKWPFRGEITICIVNQAEDDNHFEKTIFYNGISDMCAGRLSGTGKDISGEWGYCNFIAHSDLDHKAAKNTQYLKDDVIIVRVVRVKIST